MPRGADSGDGMGRGAQSWGNIGAPVSAIAAGASSLAARNLLADNFHHAQVADDGGAVAPLLLVAVVAWQLSSGLRNALPSPQFPAWLLGAIALLSVMP